MTNQYFKLTQEVRALKINVMQVCSIFYEHCVVSYGIPAYVMTDSCTQIMSEFFQTLSNSVGLKRVTTMLYNPQMSGQAKQYYWTLVAKTNHYVSENQSNWDIFPQPLTYAYKTLVNRLTKTTLLSLVLSRHQSGPTCFDCLSILTAGTDHVTTPSVLQLK